MLRVQVYENGLETPIQSDLVDDEYALARTIMSVLQAGGSAAVVVTAAGDDPVLSGEEAARLTADAA